MYKYLLPGSEFHDALRSKWQDVDSTVQTAVFAHTHSVEHIVANLDHISAASDNSEDVKACLSEDGACLYVYSDYDIRCLDCQMLFYRMSNLKKVYFSNFNTDDCQSMRRMFMNCSSLQYVNMHGLTSPDVEDFTEMFSGCSSCLSIDVSSLQVPSTAETCVFSDMFKNCSSLRRITVDEKFTFNPSMSLSNPDASIVKESDGKWHFPLTGESFDASALAGGKKGTYYACDVASSSHDFDAVSLGALKSAVQTVAMEVSKKL